MEEMEELYLAIKQGGSVRDEWSSWLDTLGHQVRVAWGEQVYEGYAQGVDEDGSLLLRLPNGSLKTLAAGVLDSRIKGIRAMYQLAFSNTNGVWSRLAHSPMEPS